MEQHTAAVLGRIALKRVPASQVSRGAAPGARAHPAPALAPGELRTPRAVLEAVASYVSSMEAALADRLVSAGVGGQREVATSPPAR